MRFLLLFSLLILVLPVDLGAQTAEDTSAVTFTVEADTLVPAFYNGRPEPTPGSTIRFHGVVSKGESGSYTFVWNINGATTVASTNTPHHTATTTAPEARDIVVSLTVRDRSGTRVGEAERVVRISEPELGFYAENLLRGLRETAITGRYLLVGEEVTIHALPYFINSAYIETPYERTWQVDGAVAAQNTDNPHTLIIDRASVREPRTISFSARNRTALTQAVQGSFEVSIP